jgi:hypothetical protein
MQKAEAPTEGAWMPELEISLTTGRHPVTMLLDLLGFRFSFEYNR